MPPKKERYNAKARQSVAGGHSHKQSKGKGKAKAVAEGTGTADDLPAPTFDPNAAILDEEAKERDRQRRQLLAEAGNDDQVSLSSKKKKRLDKYIASRIKKEERVEILAKLAESSQEFSNRAELKSAATLGTGKVRSVGERVEKLIGKEQKVGNGGRAAKRKRAAAFEIEEDDDDADLDEDGEGSGRRGGGSTSTAAASQRGPTSGTAAVELDDAEEVPTLSGTSESVNPVKTAGDPAPAFLAPLPLPAGIGSALALGPDGKPAVTVRKKKTKKPKKGALLAALTAQADDADSDMSDAEQQTERDAPQQRNGEGQATGPTEKKSSSSSRP